MYEYELSMLYQHFWSKTSDNYGSNMQYLAGSTAKVDVNMMPSARIKENSMKTWLRGGNSGAYIKSILLHPIIIYARGWAFHTKFTFTCEIRHKYRRNTGNFTISFGKGNRDLACFTWVFAQVNSVCSRRNTRTNDIFACETILDMLPEYKSKNAPHEHEKENSKPTRRDFPLLIFLCCFETCRMESGTLL